MEIIAKINSIGEQQEKINNDIFWLKVWLALQLDKDYNQTTKSLLSQVYRRLTEIETNIQDLGKAIRRLLIACLKENERRDGMRHFHIHIGLPGCYPDTAHTVKDFRTALEIAKSYVDDEIEYLAQMGIDDDKLDDYENDMKANLEIDGFTWILPQESRHIHIVPCCDEICEVDIE